MSAPANLDPAVRGGRTGWQLTREGWFLLGIVALLLTVGIYKNINLIALLGHVLLATLGLSGLVVGRCLGRIEARRLLEVQLFAGTPARLEVRLRNPSARPAVGVRIEDIGPQHDRAWYFDRLEPGSRQVCTAELMLARRGWYDFAPLTASSSYPFGLIRRRLMIGPPVRVLVLPRPGKLVRDRLRQFLKGSDPHGEHVHRRGWRHEAAQADFHGLRAFRPGDSPRWIHWRTSARRGELMVREFEDVPGDDLVCVLDTRCASPELFEHAITLSATLVAAWCERRGDRLVLLVAGPRPELFDGVSGPEHGRQLLECLALAARSEPDASSGLELLRDHAPKTAALLVVSAGPSDLPDALEGSAGRPVAHLNAEERQLWGFYTPP